MIRKGTNERKPKRVKRVLSDADRSRLNELRQRIDAEKDEILAEAKRQKSSHDAVASRLRDVMRLLHAERIRQDLSLADMQSRTGIARSALSRLETESDANPTLTTLSRYADALGKELQILLADKAASS